MVRVAAVPPISSFTDPKSFSAKKVSPGSRINESSFFVIRGIHSNSQWAAAVTPNLSRIGFCKVFPTKEWKLHTSRVLGFHMNYQTKRKRRTKAYHFNNSHYCYFPVPIFCGFEIEVWRCENPQIVQPKDGFDH